MVVICQEPGCQKQAKYGEAGCKKRLFCSEHGAAKGLQRVSSHRPCSFPDCSRLARGTTQFCARHRRELHARLAEGEHHHTPVGTICSSMVDTSSHVIDVAFSAKTPLSAGLHHYGSLCRPTAQEAESTGAGQAAVAAAAHMLNQFPTQFPVVRIVPYSKATRVPLCLEALLILTRYFSVLQWLERRLGTPCTTIEQYVLSERSTRPWRHSTTGKGEIH